MLSFGAGILVANIFDDDDDDYYKNGYYNPRYYGPPMPYYPPYPYRPNYGNSYHPSYGYSRPPNYQHSFNNNTIIVNNNTNNNYWGRHNAPSTSGYNSRSVQSPITAAKPNRPELNTLNAQANQRPKRQAPPPSQSYKGQSSYAGARIGREVVHAECANRESVPVTCRSLRALTPVRNPVHPPARSRRRRPMFERPSRPKPDANAQRPAAPERNAKPAAPQVSKPAARPAATPPKAPQGTKPPATAKPSKPKTTPTKPKTTPAKPQKG